MDEKYGRYSLHIAFFQGRTEKYFTETAFRQFIGEVN